MYCQPARCSGFHLHTFKSVKSKLQFGTILWLLTALVYIFMGKILYSMPDWDFWESGNSSKNLPVTGHPFLQLKE